MPEIVGEDRKPVPVGAGGWLTITKPWPGMLRGIWGDDERYKIQYWTDVPGKYLCGDNARCDEDGYYWIMGRIDDVLNVSGPPPEHDRDRKRAGEPRGGGRGGGGRPAARHQGRGRGGVRHADPAGSIRPRNCGRSLKNHVRKEIGALAVPDDIHFTTSLPKTRSGKIMRRLLRDIAAGRETVGDTSTLEDYSVLARLRTEEE